MAMLNLSKLVHLQERVTVLLPFDLLAFSGRCYVTRKLFVHLSSCLYMGHTLA